MATAVGLSLCAPGMARAALESKNAYLDSAIQLENKNDLKGAEIQLRNAAEQEPNNGAIRVELAKVYLKLGNPSAAQAELAIARQNNVKEEQLAPLLAQAFLEAGDAGNLLRNVPAGNRPAKIESLVRTYRAIAAMSLGELDNANTMLRDAERLDPASAMPKITAARILLLQKQYKAAELKANQALSIAPNDSTALEVKGLALMLQGNPSGAMGQFNAALSHNPRDVQVLLDRANLEANRNQLEAAENDLRAVRAISPNIVMAMYISALVDTKKGDFKSADAALEKVRPAMDQFPDAYFLAGEVKYKLNQFAQAENYFNKYIAQRHDQPRAFEILGALALRRNESGRAVTMLERAYQLAPNDPNIAALLAQAYVAHGDARKAAALMDKTAAQHPANGTLQSERALTHFATGDSSGTSLSELNNLFNTPGGELMAAPPLILAQLRAGKADDAAKTAEQMVKHDPANLLYQELLGTARAAQHNYPAAESIFKGVLAKKPSLLAARHNLAEVYLATNRGNDAVALFRDWLSKNPADLKAKTTLAEIYLQKKDYGNAEALLKDMQAGAQTDSGAGLQLAHVYEQQKRWPDAIATARALQAKFPKDQAVLDTLGRIYSESGDQSSSVAVYKSATAQFPQSAFLWKNYGVALYASKNMPAALDALTKALTLEPGNQQLERALVNLTYQTKGVAAAQALGQSFESPNSQLPLGALLTADALYKDGKHDAAIALLETSQKQKPSSAAAAVLAKYYAADGKAPKAIATLEEWSKAHPDDVLVRYGLAQLYGSSGNSTAALAQFEWLVGKRPNDPVVLNNLAWLYSQKNDPRARQTAERAYKLAPQSGDVADTLGWIVLQQGDVVNGLKYLQIASRLSPQSFTVQLHLAIAMTKNNQPQNARPILERLLNSSADASVKNSAQEALAKLGG
ncbi:MAG TPA: XrtA/PEP-CTERM system TPR-repeat protein PrsT [Rhizomicrobium sp.]|nr:XrtA/PEP-CTERM system TPR-repeat protein PrsT [Rhizomicrobium sp.]